MDRIWSVSIIINTIKPIIDSMKSKKIIEKDDICIVCDGPCPSDVYNCPKLNEAISKKTVYYRWCWINNNEQ